MKKRILLLAVAVGIAGCATPPPPPLTAKPVTKPPTTVRTGVAPIGVVQNDNTFTDPRVLTSPATPRDPNTSGGKSVPLREGRVVEIITKPKLVERPADGGPSPAAAPPTALSAADAPAPKLTLDSFARVDAAVSCAPLVRLLAMKLNHVPYSGFAGYGSLDFTPNLPEGTDPDKMTNDVLTREPGGTTVAIGRLTAGEVDLVLAPRLPDPAEAAAAAAKKLRLRSDLVATEALVFTVNAANPVYGLSRPQLSQVFTGAARQWKDLGDTVPPTSPIADQPITVAYRARGTGSEELLRQLLLQGKPMPELPVSRALSASKLVLDASGEDAQTIGFSVFAYASNMKRDGRVRVLAVDGVVPEPNRVASGQYPLTTPIYVITRADLGSDNELYKLRQWLGSMAGQKVLAEAGYMPVSSEAWTAVRLMGK